VIDVIVDGVATCRACRIIVRERFILKEHLALDVFFVKDFECVPLGACANSEDLIPVLIEV
jgi:hypothetical protein